MTVIACDCSADPDMLPSVVRCEWRKARKPHVCCECNGPIVPRARYEHVDGCWDREWSTYKTCEVCTKIRAWYCPGGYAHGELAQQIYDCLEFDYREVPVDDEEGID